MLAAFNGTKRVGTAFQRDDSQGITVYLDCDVKLKRGEPTAAITLVYLTHESLDTSGSLAALLAVKSEVTKIVT
jgi:hypothetical protein